MVFKLIRVDVEEPSKIQLLVGKHVIGRGKFLHNDDTDKKVSRNHAELEVTDDSLTLKSIHQNPCFYTKNNTVDIEILQQNSTITLCHGDKFGLVPENFWYQVIHCSNQDIPKKSTTYLNENNKVENAVEEKSYETKEKKENGEEHDITTNSGSKDDEAINFDMSEGVDCSNRSASPSLLTTEDKEATEEYKVNDQQAEEPSEEHKVNNQEDKESTEEYNVNNQEDEESTEEYKVNDQAPDPSSTPNKRRHDSCDSSPIDLKKVKTEPATPDGQVAQPGPSNDQNVSDSDNKDQKPDIAAPAPVAPAARLRERCLYGANCYRRNPQHKAQFSHPSDSDWGAGERGVCPYGRACCKADPRHWHSHEHPPGVNPPDPIARRPGMQVVQRQGNIFYINAHSVNFYDDHFQVEDSDGDSVDYDYEF